MLRTPAAWPASAASIRYSLKNDRLAVGVGNRGAAILLGHFGNALRRSVLGGNLLGARLGDIPVLAEFAIYVAAGRGYRECNRPRQIVEERLLLDGIDVCRAHPRVHQRVVGTAAILAHAAIAALLISHRAFARTQLALDLRSAASGKTLLRRRIAHRPASRQPRRMDSRQRARQHWLSPAPRPTPERTSKTSGDPAGPSDGPGLGSRPASHLTRTLSNLSRLATRSRLHLDEQNSFGIVRAQPVFAHRPRSQCNVALGPRPPASSIPFRRVCAR